MVSGASSQSSARRSNPPICFPIIFTPEFFQTLKAVTDETYYLPGVDRAQVTSIFTPNVRYIEVVEEGLQGGNVIPADFTPTPEGFEQVRANIVKSGRLGMLVANDYTGAAVIASLQEVDPQTGLSLDYAKVAEALETSIREKFQTDAISVHTITRRGPTRSASGPPMKPPTPLANRYTEIAVLA